MSITQMRIPPLNLILRQFSTIMAKEVKVEPYSMAFVTAPNKDVAKKLAGGLGKLPTYILPIRGDNEFMFEFGLEATLYSSGPNNSVVLNT